MQRLTPFVAMAESFFATLKTEFYYRRVWPTKTRARLEVGAWIEERYNRPGDTPQWDRSAPSPSSCNTATRPRQIRQPHNPASTNRGQGQALDADPAAAFDRIDHHGHLLNQFGTFPARGMIAGWLATGVVDRGRPPYHGRHLVRWGDQSAATERRPARDGKRRRSR